MTECYNVCVFCATKQTVYHSPQSTVHTDGVQVRGLIWAIGHLCDVALKTSK